MNIESNEIEERILIIITNHYIENKKGITVKEISSHFDCSIKTIRIWLNYLFKPATSGRIRCTLAYYEKIQNKYIYFPTMAQIGFHKDQMKNT